MTLGNAIRLIRTAAGQKQTELASALRVSPNYLSLVENGKRQPSVSFLRRLSDVLGVPVSIFFLWQEIDSPQKMQESVAKIRDSLAQLEAMYLLARSRKPRRKQNGNAL